MDSKKTAKVESKLKEIISECLYNQTMEIQSNFGLITVNYIKLASDLSYIDVYVSSLKNKELLCKNLAKYAQEVKVEINNRMPLRKTPIVRFRYDETMEISTDLINKINNLEINE